MDISIQKLGLIHWLTELNDVATLNVIEHIKESKPTDNWWSEISMAEKILSSSMRHFNENFPKILLQRAER